MQDKKQREMKEQIAMLMGKNDYYQILGLENTCSETDIKKAYKRLALRFHPDKNSVQGSKELFRKVSHAYTTLSNPQKRQRYNQYGPQEFQQPNHDRYQDQNLEDILNNLFNHQFRRQQFGNHRNQSQFNMGQDKTTIKIKLWTLFFFIFLLTLYLFWPIFKQKPYFSQIESEQYKLKVNTNMLNVPYFAREGFQMQAQNHHFKKQIDQIIDLNYIGNLKNSCKKSINIKKIYEYRAYSINPGQQRQQFLKRASEVGQSNCSKLKQIQTNYKKYYYKLTHRY